MERKNRKAVGICISVADLQKLNRIKGEYGYNRNHFVNKAVVEHLREKGYEVEMPEIFNTKEKPTSKIYKEGKSVIFKVFFSDDVYDALSEVAVKEHRVVSSQALYYVMQKMKETENVGV